MYYSTKNADVKKKNFPFPCGVPFAVRETSRSRMMPVTGLDLHFLPCGKKIDTGDRTRFTFSFLAEKKIMDATSF
jgi:hypothetical protein